MDDEIEETIQKILEETRMTPVGGFVSQNRFLEREIQLEQQKFSTCWNGLSIWAYAVFFQKTGNSSYYKQGKKATKFVRANLMTANGKLKKYCYNKIPWKEGDFCDYVFYGIALLEFYQCDYDISWLRTCIKLMKKMMVEMDIKFHQDSLYLSQKNLYENIPENEIEIADSFQKFEKENYETLQDICNKIWGMDLEIVSEIMAGYLFILLFKITKDKVFQQVAERQRSFLEGFQEIFLKKFKRSFGKKRDFYLLLQQVKNSSIFLYVTDGEIPEEELRCYGREENVSVYIIVMTEENQKSLKRLLPILEEYDFKKTGYQILE